ncbi:MAG: NAD-dependent epimerase/dehydratase family protein [Clostridia bacterium]|nr:NAD-dependent epimerase/dehydratase family protein [Clostridia bacterium]
MDILKGKTVLVTGAAGLIGSTFVERLLGMENGPVVVAAGRSPERLRERFSAYADEPRLRFAAYDAVREPAFDFSADWILHAASSAHPRAYAQDPVGTMKGNLLGVMYLLEYLRNCPGGRMIFLSTGEIYGDHPEREEGFSETDRGRLESMDPRACYPESKRAGEAMIASYHSQYGVDALATRLCHVYGPAITPSNSRADAQFLRNALAGEPIVMKSRGEQVRSFCYVEDAVDALLTLFEKGEPGRAYNVANSRSVHSIREYAETLARLSGVDLRFELPDAVEKAGYTRVSRAVLDATRLRALGWEPRYDLEAGLRDMLEKLRGL